MINDNEFKARLREAVLDFLKKDSRIPTQKELGNLYGIKPHNLDYFKSSRGYKSIKELLEECIGSDILKKYQKVPFEKQLRTVLIKHMGKFGCLPLGREYELYGISYWNIRYKARASDQSIDDYLWSLVKDDIQGTDLKKCFVHPQAKKREFDRELIKKRLQDGYGISSLVKKFKTNVRTLERFLKDNDLEKYIPDRQTRLRKAKGLKDGKLRILKKDGRVAAIRIFLHMVIAHSLT